MADKCACDKCAHLENLLCAFQTAGFPNPLASQLQEQLDKHRRRASLLPLAACLREEDLAEKLSLQQTRCPWLPYDPDALLPLPFDAFLLGGGCPRLCPGAPPCEPIDDASGGTSYAGALARPQLSVCYIVGCGRSGTTILADVLSMCKQVAYLNEPRQLWLPFWPDFDVWSVAAPQRQGRLDFAAEEAARLVTPAEMGRDADADELHVVEAVSDLPTSGDDTKSQRVADLVFDIYQSVSELVAQAHEQNPCHEARDALEEHDLDGRAPLQSQRVLVEKLPEHSFRLPFLAAVCERNLRRGGRCFFIHVVRNGVDVARSIARFEDLGTWYGAKDEWKWRALVAHLRATGAWTAAEPAGSAMSDAFVAMLDDSSNAERRRFARGLVEWGASVLAAREGAACCCDAPTAWSGIRGATCPEASEEEAMGACEDAAAASTGGSTLPAYIEVRYEDLVADPAATLGQLAACLGVVCSEDAAQTARDMVRAARASPPPSKLESSVIAAARHSFLEPLLQECGAVPPPDAEAL